MASSTAICLGIDLGTTSVKVSLVDKKSKSLIFSSSEPTNADISSAVGASGSEQDAGKIFRALNACLMRITDSRMSNVCCISLSGQMHGVVLWNSESQIRLSDGPSLAAITSNLFTWEDKRGTNEFLACLPKPDSHQSLASGFGCVTLFWLLKNSPETLVTYDCAGGIMDYLTTLLCGIDRPVMSDQIAASWGYFNCETRTWNTDILKNAGFPVHLLPVVVEGGKRVGELCRDWCGIPQGTPVLAGLGDLQCSFVSAVKEEKDSVMNISTSSQVCYPVSHQNFVPPRPTTPGPVSYFPFFRQTYLAVAASLNGGNVLEAFVTMVKQWFGTFGIEMTTDTIWDKLTEISTHNATEGDLTGSSMPFVQPVLFGERHSPEARASISGITHNNTSLDCIFKSLCRGIISNLHQMMPQSLLIESGITRLVLTGSVIHRQPCIRDFVHKLYTPLPVVEVTETDASFGAAIVGVEHLESR